MKEDGVEIGLKEWNEMEMERNMMIREMWYMKENGREENDVLYWWKWRKGRWKEWLKRRREMENCWVWVSTRREWKMEDVLNTGIECWWENVCMRRTRWRKCWENGKEMWWLSMIKEWECMKEDGKEVLKMDLFEKEKERSMMMMESSWCIVEDLWMEFEKEWEESWRMD